jgi:hypothetical protein
LEQLDARSFHAPQRLSAMPKKILREKIYATASNVVATLALADKLEISILERALMSLQ